MTWWDDLWLNEGFASWAENYAADKLRPDYCMWEQFTTGALSTAMQLDALKSSHPIQVPIHRAEEVEQVFDAISYCKGASVVRMIRAVLGTKFFQAGLSMYMEKFAYGNTETVDLWGAWEDVSGMPVKEVMATWTEQMGFPLVKVVGEDWQADKVVLKLEQSWFLSDGSELDAEGLAKTWTIPVMSCTCEGTQADMTLMREKTGSITIPLSGAEAWVKLNAGQEVPMRVLCTAEMFRRIAPAIQGKTMSSIDRASLLNDTYAVVKARHAPPSDLIKLLVNYADEDDFIVWEGIASCLLGIDLIVSDQKELSESFRVFAKRMVVGLVKKVGWDEKPSDGHVGTLLRSVMLRLVGTFAYDDSEVVQEASARFEAFKQDPNDVKSLPSDMRSPVFRIVLKNGGEKDYEEVKKYFYTAPNNAERMHVLGTLGHTKIEALKKATMEWSTSGEIKLQDFFYAMGSVGSSGKEGRDISWQFFQDNFQKIKKMIEKANPSIMNACIVTCAGSFSSTAKANEIESFFEANPLPSSSRRISQLLEGMRANAQLLDLILASDLSKAEFWNSI
jgi:puromycin-sensitive aminopeptidase